MSGVLSLLPALLLVGCTKELPPCGDDDWCLVRQGVVHACALRGDGTPSCWAWHGNVEPESEDDIYGKCLGNLDCGQMSLMPEEEVFVDLQFNTGTDTVCGLTPEGDVVCWGYRHDSLSRSGQGYVDMGVGWAHACGVTAGGEVECWGELLFQYDYGTQRFEGSLDPPAGTSSISDVECGELHCCAISTEGSVTCWGIDDPGRDYDHGQASDAPTSTGWAAIVAGDNASCALKEETEQWSCWGTHDWCDVGTAPCFEEEADRGLAPLDDTPLLDLDLAERGLGLSPDRTLVGAPRSDSYPWPGEHREYRQVDRGSGGCGVLTDFSLLCWSAWFWDTELEDDWEGVWEKVPVDDPDSALDSIYRLEP